MKKVVQLSAWIIEKSSVRLTGSEGVIHFQHACFSLLLLCIVSCSSDCFIKARFNFRTKVKQILK
jgi:hypothetical protein